MVVSLAGVPAPPDGRRVAPPHQPEVAWSDAITRGLSAVWPATAGTGLLLPDLVRGGHARLTGAGFGAGALGGAIALTGSTYATATSTALSTNTPYSVLSWCRPASTSAGPANLYTNGGAPSTGYSVQLRRSASTWELYHWVGTVNTAVSSATAVAGKDTCLVGTWDGAQMQLYVDGVLRGGPTTWGRARANTQHDLGANARDFGAGTPGQFWDGLIYLTALWERALTDSEIARLAREPYAVLATPRAWATPPAPGAGGGGGGGARSFVVISA